jgi:DNA-binding HxlR family transcriptional regulator
MRTTETRTLLKENTLRIVQHLASTAAAGFSELQRVVNEPHPPIMSKHLKKLVRDGVVARVIVSTDPMRTRYQLTDLGHDLAKPASGILAWLDRNRDQIMATRQLNKIADINTGRTETAAE